MLPPTATQADRQRAGETDGTQLRVMLSSLTLAQLRQYVAREKMGFPPVANVAGLAMATRAQLIESIQDGTYWRD